MEKTIEDLITSFKKNSKAIAELMQEQDKIIHTIESRPDKDWEWVSVQTASKKLDISQAMIYQRITRGKLKCRKFENKIYVSINDLMNIDDKVANDI